MISGLCWNIRGVSKKGIVCLLKSIISNNNISFCAILEPKAQVSKIISFARKLGFSSHLHGDPTNTHIWIFLEKIG